MDRKSRNRPRCIAVVQARMGSQRLPGKVLKKLGSRTLLDEVILRGQMSGVCDEVVVATSVKPQDDAIAQHCEKAGVICHRGSEDDVLDRIYQAAVAEGADHVVRLTADNPLLDPETLAAMVRLHLEERADYTHCITSWGCDVPYGVGVEVFAMPSLEASWKEGLEPMHREHVDEFVYERPERFKILRGSARVALRRSELRFTVDTESDLTSMREIFASLELVGEVLSVSKVIEWLDCHPETRALFRSDKL